MSRLFLIRHAQSVKNVEDKHGGSGDSLTEVGILQCNALASFLRDHEHVDGSSVIVTHDVPQTIQTAQAISELISSSIEYEPLLVGISLGVLAGLTREMAQRYYPEDAERLRYWDEGLIRIDELRIQNAESAYAFHQRILRVVKENLESHLAVRDVVVICTRSVLIMFANMFTLNDTFNFEDYRYYNFRNASMTKCNYRHSVFELAYMNKTDFLGEM